MTRKEIISLLVNDHIERGLIKEEDRKYHMRYRLREMNLSACYNWYKEYLQTHQVSLK